MASNGQTNLALNLDEGTEMDQQKEENQMDVTESIRQPHQHALLYSVDDVPPWHLSCLSYRGRFGVCVYARLWI